MTFEIEVGDGLLTFLLTLKSCRWVVGGWVYLDYNVSSGPFLSFEIEIGDGPGTGLDNSILSNLVECSLIVILGIV